MFVIERQLSVMFGAAVPADAGQKFTRNALIAPHAVGVDGGVLL
jgi:hypothetical protein